jgi:hypothetical protein
MTACHSSFQYTGIKYVYRVLLQHSQQAGDETSWQFVDCLVFQKYIAAIWWAQPRHAFEQCGFPNAIRPQKAPELSRAELEIQTAADALAGDADIKGITNQ